MTFPVPEEPELSTTGEPRESPEAQDEALGPDAAAEAGEAMSSPGQAGRPAFLRPDAAAEAGEVAPGESPVDEPVSTSPDPVSHEPDVPASAELSEKPVLEWTTEDWARWIEEPPSVSRPAPETDFLARWQAEPVTDPDAGGDVEVGQGEVPTEAQAFPTETSITAAPAEVPGDDTDATGVWSIALDRPEDDDDARWWTSVAGSTDPPLAPIPAEIDPLADPTPLAPIPAGDPPDDASPADPIPAEIDPFADPPTPVAVPPRAPPPFPAPRSSPWRGHALEPHDTAVRIRAGLSLLGVSVLVGAVAAGLITVAIFMAAVVLRHALG